MKNQRQHGGFVSARSEREVEAALAGTVSEGVEILHEGGIGRICRWYWAVWGEPARTATMGWLEKNLFISQRIHTKVALGWREGPEKS